MPLCGLFIVALSLGALPAVAQPLAQRKRWATMLGRETLSRSSVGVLGVARRVTGVGGQRVTVIQIDPDEVLWGQLPEGVSQLSAVRAERGSREEEGGKVVAFLTQLRNSWQVVAMFHVSGEEGARQLGVLRKHLALERLPSAEQDEAHRALILAGLRSGDDWEFSLTLGELYKRIVERRGALDLGLRKAVSRLAFDLPKRSHQEELRELLRLLPPASPGASVRSPRAGPRKPPSSPDGAPLVADEALRQLAAASNRDERVARLLALAEFRGAGVRRALVAALSDEEPAISRASAFALGQLKDSRARSALESAVSGSADVETARRALRALGQLADPASVALLTRCLARTALVDEALIALGRIEGAPARAALIDFASRCPHAGRKRLAEYCASGALRR